MSPFQGLSIYKTIGKKKNFTHMLDLLQLYVGGNAALIGQKLAANPNLKVSVSETWFYLIVFNKASNHFCVYSGESHH